MKLFLFSGSPGEWKARGTGDLKLLKSRATGYVRIILRQDKTLKIRLNHKVQPVAELKANEGNDKSWVFTASDFAEETEERGLFAIRFKESGASCGGACGGACVGSAAAARGHPARGLVSRRAQLSCARRATHW